MIDLTRGRARVCKGQGGLSEIYILPYDESAVLTISGNTLTNITPTQTIYRFYSTSGDYQDKMSEDGGGKYHDQSLSLTFPVIKYDTELPRLLKKDYWVIVKDRNGLYRFLGAENGGTFNNLKEQTGGGQSDLSGYTINYEAKEKLSALYTDLTGFIITQGFLLLEDGTFLLLEDGETIILE
jgi:hypothetical protein